MNPLGRPGVIFDLELVNPNPTSSKTKEGAVYRVSFEVPRETWDFFMEADTKGMLLAAKATVVGTGEEAEAIEPAKKGPYGAYASIIRTRNIHLAWAVCEALGGDQAFLRWLRVQSCVGPGDTHQGDVVAAHVRRVNKGAGVGVKPAYSAIPLCSSCHSAQHQHGESALGSDYWWGKQVNKSLNDWAWAALKDALGVQSMTQASPEKIYEWFCGLDLQYMLPDAFKGGYD